MKTLVRMLMAGALGLPAGSDYLLNNLWSGQTVQTRGLISAVVPSHGVALYRVSSFSLPAWAPPAPSQ